jgi:ketosteroid isomerase-like protein
MQAEDHEQIRNILALYVHVIDNRQWDRLDEVYAPDGSYGARDSPHHDGVEAIGEYLASIFQPVTHMSSNHHIELARDGQTATGVGEWHSVLADRSVLAGSYDDAYTKTDAGWRIQRRTYFVAVTKD